MSRRPPVSEEPPEAQSGPSAPTASLGPELALRTTPSQQRSRHTVEVLLAAAAELLDERGSEALTTSAVAERCGLHVRNVYRYFPNREAMLVALAQRLNQRIEDAVGELSILSRPSSDWRDEVQGVVARIQLAVDQTKGGAQLRAATRITPSLQAQDDASSQRVAALLAQAIGARRGVLPDQRLLLRSFAVVTAVGAVLDRALSMGGVESQTLLDEAVLIAQAALATLLEA